MNQSFLDRQYHLSIFHEKLELIVSGGKTRVVLGLDRVELGPDDVAGLVRRRGWSLRVDSPAASSGLSSPTIPMEIRPWALPWAC